AARREAERAWNDARLARAGAQSRAEAARREAERADADLADLARRAQARQAEQERLEAALEEDAPDEHAERAAQDEARRQTDALRTARNEAEEAVLSLRAAITGAEKHLRTLRAAREAATAARADAERSLAELAVRRETLLDRLRNEHGAHLAEADAAREALAGEDAAPLDPDAARAEIPRLREQLRALGAVNALALENYDEEKQRLDFLTAQRADVQQAEADLVATIDEINAAAAARFDETFAAVRAAFQKLFRDLFGGDAAADLALEGDDPLEAPIEITARPRGKRPVSIGQLSGGEKTLTAIALLFAIYLVKPSPFCILDEVDAPLDDANVGRFMQLIRSFAGQTQFILVTHNKLTMEAADRMYGVTMPDPGVSRLVGVRFDEHGAPADAGAPAEAVSAG
ncbi:MAG: AAA family ATPase, partial [Rubricoccaceae bacterium]